MKLSLADLVMGSIGKACVDHKTFLNKTKIISFLSCMWKICHLGPNFTKISLWKLKGQIIFFCIFQVPPTILKVHSCGTVALYGPFYLFFLRTIGLRFSLYQKLSKLCKKNLAQLFCQFLSWNRVRERSNIYISFR